MRVSNIIVIFVILEQSIKVICLHILNPNMRVSYILVINVTIKDPRKGI